MLIPVNLIFFCSTVLSHTVDKEVGTAHARELAIPLISREILHVGMAVLLETTLGDIVIDLFTEERPKGTQNRV